MASREKMARRAAPALFLGCAAVEVVRTILHQSPQGLVPSFSSALGLLLAVLWCASAVVVALGMKSAIEVPIFGTLLLLTWGVVMRSAGSQLAILYIAVSPIITVLERVAFAGALGWYEPARLPQPNAPHADVPPREPEPLVV
jgi:hypothetical protein